MNNSKREIPIAEKKLTQLAERFIDFLENNHSEIIDINTAAEILQIRNKRRLVDIINILENIDLVEKVDKNKIVWRGSNSFTNNADFHQTQIKLTEDIKNLDELLVTSEIHLNQLKQSLLNVTTEPENVKYAYITKNELEEIWPDKNLILVKSSDQINISFPKVDEDLLMATKKYKIKIKRFTHEPTVFYLPIASSFKKRCLQEIINIDEDSESTFCKIIDTKNYDALDILTPYECALDAFSDF